MANRIILNETSYFGPGAIQEIAHEVKNRRLKKVMVVTDQDLMKFKVATKITELLEQNHIDYKVYDKIKANLPSPMCRKGLLSAGSVVRMYS